MVVTIIGLGLIGGSIAISLKESGFADTIIGVDRDAENVNKALRRRLIDEEGELEAAVKKAELIILAIPVDAIVRLLPRVLDLVYQQTVIDVGSTKVPIMDIVKGHPRRANFLGTHPMAGTEFSGPEAAIPNLFDGKCTVFCNVEESHERTVNTAKAMYEALQMRVVHLNAEEHDLHTAYVSHISHISSFALALTVLEKEKGEGRIFELASGGFSSTVRLAKSSADMWVPIFNQNRDNVLDVLDEHINTLARFRSLLIKKDFGTIHKLIEQSNTIKKILKQ